MKRLRNIRRIDTDANRTYAWLVQVQRQNRIIIKMFTDAVYGGKRKALAAAIGYRDQVIAEANPVGHRLWCRTILRRNNTSGIVGVARYDKLANPSTGRREVFWLAAWVDEYGASRKRKFSVLRYGERKARQLAIAERNRQLMRVCSVKQA